MSALEEYRRVRSLSTAEVRRLTRDDWWVEPTQLKLFNDPIEGET